MNRNSNASRRAFLKSGALLAAPLAAVSASSVVLANGDLTARVARLEDEAAICKVQRQWLREVNDGVRDGKLDTAVRRVGSYSAGEPDRIVIDQQGHTAVGYFDSWVELEELLDKESTLAQMAHVQGNGAVRRTERQMITVGYVKTRGTWALRSVATSRI